MIKIVFWFVEFQSLHGLPFLLFLSLLQLPEKHFEVSELPDDGFMQEESDVFLIVESLNRAQVAFLGFLPVLGLSRKHSLENTESAKILEKMD